MTFPDDHDQRFKGLLRHFLPSLIAMRFPDWVEHFDFEHAEWLEQEIFLDAPTGERREVDILVKLPLRRPMPRGEQGDQEARVALVHIEVENRDPMSVFRRRLHSYATEIGKRHPEPLLPLAVFLDRKLEGMGWDMLEFAFWEEWIIHFRYPYIAVKGLKAADFTEGDNLLAVALTPLMEALELEHPGVKVFSLPSVDHPEYGRHIELGVKGAPAQVVQAYPRMLAGLHQLSMKLGPELVR